MERVEKFALDVRDGNIVDINSENNSKPVFLNGTLVIDGPPSDPKFNMTTTNEACIYRKVLVYCWTEKLTPFTERKGDMWYGLVSNELLSTSV